MPSFLFIDVSVIGLSERPITETSINKQDGLIETHTRSKSVHEGPRIVLSKWERLVDGSWTGGP